MHDSCTAIVSSHKWEADDETSPLNKAMRRLNEHHGVGLVYDAPQPVRQQTISSQIDATTYRQLVDSAQDDYDKAHLKAQEANGAAWLRALPSEGLDTHLSNRDLIFGIKDRLGVDTYTRVSRCTFCSFILDTKGIHCRGCMAGGDTTLRHNAIRDLYFIKPELVECVQKENLKVY